MTGDPRHYLFLNLDLRIRPVEEAPGLALRVRLVENPGLDLSLRMRPEEHLAWGLKIRQVEGGVDEP